MCVCECVFNEEKEFALQTHTHTIYSLNVLQIMKLRSQQNGTKIYGKTKMKTKWIEPNVFTNTVCLCVTMINWWLYFYSISWWFYSVLLLLLFSATHFIRLLLHHDGGWATHTHTAYLWMKGKIIMKCKGKQQQQQQLQLVTFISNKWWIVQKFLFITLVLILDN